MAIHQRRQDMESKDFVLVHGDAHNLNILKTPTNDENDFKFIDPDGIICEPAYDLGVLMREWIDDLLPDCQKYANQRLQYLANLTGLNKVAIWHWGILQLVATGLILHQSKQLVEANRMFKVASVWTV